MIDILLFIIFILSLGALVIGCLAYTKTSNNSEFYTKDKNKPKLAGPAPGPTPTPTPKPPLSDLPPLSPKSCGFFSWASTSGPPFFPCQEILKEDSDITYKCIAPQDPHGDYCNGIKILPCSDGTNFGYGEDSEGVCRTPQSNSSSEACTSTSFVHNDAKHYCSWKNYDKDASSYHEFKLLKWFCASAHGGEVFNKDCSPWTWPPQTQTPSSPSPPAYTPSSPSYQKNLRTPNRRLTPSEFGYTCTGTLPWKDYPKYCYNKVKWDEKLGSPASTASEGALMETCNQEFCKGGLEWLQSKSVGINYSQASKGANMVPSDCDSSTGTSTVGSGRLGTTPTRPPRAFNMYTLKWCSNLLTTAMLLKDRAEKNQESDLVGEEEAMATWDRYQEAEDSFQECWIFLTGCVGGLQSEAGIENLLTFYEQLTENADAFLSGRVVGLQPNTLTPSSGPAGPTCPNPSIPACQMAGGGGTDP